MKRAMIAINEDLCDGCGACVPDCPEGALKIIDGKARLVGELLCDGLGACVGRCPTGALTVEEREADAYDEARVMENIFPKGKNLVAAHLEHLRSHGADTYVGQALEWLRARGENPAAYSVVKHEQHGDGCPGSKARELRPAPIQAVQGETQSELRQWPIQMHLLNPRNPAFAGSDFLLAADCSAFTVGAFHQTLLRGKSLGIACPKLDSSKELYVDKLVALFDESKINTLTVVIMEVPCCAGLLQLALSAQSKARRKVPIKRVVISLEGSLLGEEWI